MLDSSILDRVREKRPAFDAWCSTTADQLHPVVKLPPNRGRIDLSRTSPLFGQPKDYLELARFDAIVRADRQDRDLVLQYGGYGEVRPFYQAPEYGNAAAPRRDTHLGLDFWATAGTPVYAPCAATVHSLGYDPARLGYGATLLLEHPAGFWTLYGHLDRMSLDQLRVGQPVSAGQRIARFGAPEDNGGWPPHLHFQVMLDTLGYEGDFPGVAYAGEAARWMEVCPDPALLVWGL